MSDPGSAASALSVSVALCTHNGMPYVTEQVRSILHQTRPVSQLVLSDDASTDDTVRAVRDIVTRFRAEQPDAAPTFTVLQNDPALGVVRNFEQAVRACTGDLVALCDHDDVWVPDRVAIMAAEFERRPDLTLLHTDARLVDANGEPLGQSLFEAIEFTDAERTAEREGRAFDVLLRRNTVTGATTVFRRTLLERALPFPGAWVHDEWLAMIASIHGRVDVLDDQLIDYRQHGRNEIGAQRAGVREKLSRFGESRLTRNARLLARAEAMHEYVARTDAPPAVAETIAGKLDHERRRSALRSPRILRLAPVLAGALAGRYSRFGRAKYDIVRDLLQRD